MVFVSFLVLQTLIRRRVLVRELREERHVEGGRFKRRSASCWSHYLTLPSLMHRPQVVIALTLWWPFMHSIWKRDSPIYYTDLSGFHPQLTPADGLRGPKCHRRHTPGTCRRSVMLYSTIIYNLLPPSSMFHPLDTAHLNQPRAAPRKCKELFLTIEQRRCTNDLGW
jgi:hypothetical protein